MGKTNPDKITYSQLWNEVFEGYERKGNRVKSIFDIKSEYNQRLVKYINLCNELSPDLDEELQKLGFNVKQTIQYSDSNTPQFEEFYYNDNGDVVSISQDGDMVITFNHEELFINFDGIVGNQERIAIDWIKKMLSDEKRT